ncbi:MAG: hypothetical protein OEZ14_13835 [Acidimicrobiia bacterium]|nr:hypothetical protein [Acidimicrobiia bacterium]
MAVAANDDTRAWAALAELCHRHLTGLLLGTRLVVLQRLDLGEPVFEWEVR